MGIGRRMRWRPARPVALAVAAVVLGVVSLGAGRGVGAYDIDLGSAAGVGDLEAVKRRVAETPEAVNTADTLGYTPLAQAILQNHFEVAEYLVAHGAAVDCMVPAAAVQLKIKGVYTNPTPGPASLLYATTCAPNLAGTTWLVKHGARLDGVGGQAFDSFGMVLNRSYFKLRGAPKPDYQNQIACITAFVEAGQPLTAEDQRTLLALTIALDNRDLALLQLLLDHGGMALLVPPDEKRRASQYAVAEAIRGSSPECLAELERRQVDPALLLYYGLRRQNRELVRRALEKGADPNGYFVGRIQNPVARVDSALPCDIEIIQIMLAAGWVLRPESDSADALLHAAASFGNVRVLELLLDHGVAADCERHDPPVYEAAIAQNLPAVELLKRHGAKLWSDQYQAGLLPALVSNARYRQDAQAFNVSVYRLYAPYPTWCLFALVAGVLVGMGRWMRRRAVAAQRLRKESTSAAGREAFTAADSATGVGQQTAGSNSFSAGDGDLNPRQAWKLAVLQAEQAAARAAVAVAVVLALVIGLITVADPFLQQVTMWFLVGPAPYSLSGLPQWDRPWLFAALVGGGVMVACALAVGLKRRGARWNWWGVFVTVLLLSALNFALAVGFWRLLPDVWMVGVFGIMVMVGLWAAWHVFGGIGRQREIAKYLALQAPVKSAAELTQEVEARAGWDEGITKHEK